MPKPRNWRQPDKDHFVCHRCGETVRLGEIHQFDLQVAVIHLQGGHEGVPDLWCATCRPLTCTAPVAVCRGCLPACVDLAIAKAAETVAVRAPVPS